MKATASLASGPCSYMDVFDHSCATVESAGARRGAQMGVLRIDHPDVLEFITAKRTPGRWSNFNVSVGVNDAFMQILREGGTWELVHRARPGAALIEAGAHQRDDGLWVYRSIAATQLWDTVMRSAYDFAEPGILFLDTIDRDNNLRWCEKITATNPCVTADTWVHDHRRPGAGARPDRSSLRRRGRRQGFPGSQRRLLPHRPQAGAARCSTREGHSLRLTADHRVRTRRAPIALRAARSRWAPAAELQRGRRDRAARPPRH